MEINSLHNTTSPYRKTTETSPTILNTDSTTIFVALNTHPIADLNGDDLYEARLKEFPGLVAYGKTAQQASELLIEQAKSDFHGAMAERRSKLQAIQAQVQFNHRITPAEKAFIAQRAAAVGLSIRQFMMNQCIHAPIWTGQPANTLSPEQLEAAMRGTVEAHKRKPPLDSNNP